MTTLKRTADQLDLQVHTELSAEYAYAFNLGHITAGGAERISRWAFELAGQEERQEVTIITKRNANPQMYSIWEDAFFKVAERYPEIQAEELNVDVAAMCLVRDPPSFPIILISNLFGDILSDLAAEICGSLGFGGNGNANPNGVSMFEPIHDSVPKYAGVNGANPIATIIVGSMMMENLGAALISRRIDRAICATGLWEN